MSFIYSFFDSSTIYILLAQAKGSNGHTLAQRKALNRNQNTIYEKIGENAAKHVQEVNIHVFNNSNLY